MAKEELENETSFVLEKQTFLSRAIADEAAEATGRFAAAREPATIVGVAMPKLAAPAWSTDSNLLGPEEPLGIDVDAVVDMTKVQR